jgi:hypothetical protein
MAKSVTVLVYGQPRISGPFYQPPVAIWERKEHRFPAEGDVTAEDMMQFLGDGQLQIGEKKYGRVLIGSFTVHAHTHPVEHLYIPTGEEIETGLH